MTRIAVMLSQSTSNDGMYDFSVAESLVKKLKADNADVCIYTRHEVKESTFQDAELNAIPSELDTFPKMLNYVLKTEKSKDSTKFLHVVPDCIEVISSTTKFTEALEKVMKHLKLKSWLSTTCDPMNYVYTKYNPRLKIILEGEDAEAAGTQELLFTSHANTSWMCFDLAAELSDLQFDEQFTVPMYYIIAFLARRRAKSDGLDFMNMYPTVPEEKGVFKCIYVQPQADEDTMKAENDKFKLLGLDTSATNLVDTVLEKMLSTMNEQRKEDNADNQV